MKNRLTAIVTTTALSVGTIVAPAAVAAEYEVFVASNNVRVPYIEAANGSEGTLVYLNGDGTRRYTTPSSNLVRTVAKNSQREDVSALVLLPPENADSWWAHRNVDKWAVAVREFVDSLDTPAVEVAGYSGGAEFIARHLMLKDTSWAPENISATMIGGGSIGGYTVAPPAEGKEDLELDWIVGRQDTTLLDQPFFNARAHAQRSESAYKEKGFQNTSYTLVDCDHYSYDLPEILDTSVKEMKAATRSETPAPEPSTTAKPSPTASSKAKPEPSPTRNQSTEQSSATAQSTSKNTPVPSLEKSTTTKAKPSTSGTGEPSSVTPNKSSASFAGLWAFVQHLVSELMEAFRQGAWQR